MSKTIFRTINGRIVPMIVDEEIIANYNVQPYMITPKHQSKKIKLNIESAFLCPNAKCRKCEKDVFYYENSNGSRVLFDALGPPSPVHPCYAEFVEKKRTKVTAKELGWYPVFIEKYVITSRGSLRIQAKLGQEEIRFTFDQKTFSKMRISIDDVSSLIIFASIKKRKVQTHNGKKTFTSSYDVINKEIDFNHKENTEEENKIDMNIYGKQKYLSYRYQMIEITDNSNIIAQFILKTCVFNKHFLEKKNIYIKKQKKIIVLFIKQNHIYLVFLLH